jgi:hypothetical protein
LGFLRLRGNSGSPCSHVLPTPGSSTKSTLLLSQAPATCFSFLSFCQLPPSTGQPISSTARAESSCSRPPSASSRPQRAHHCAVPGNPLKTPPDRVLLQVYHWLPGHGDSSPGLVWPRVPNGSVYMTSVCPSSTYETVHGRMPGQQRRNCPQPCSALKRGPQLYVCQGTPCSAAANEKYRRYLASDGATQ